MSLASLNKNVLDNTKPYVINLNLEHMGKSESNILLEFVSSEAIILNYLASYRRDEWYYP